MSITIEMRRVPVVNGKAYASMDEFKRGALTELFGIQENGRGSYTPEQVADRIVSRADDVIEILTLNTRSRPQMRKDRKARKPRKDATIPLPDNT